MSASFNQLVAGVLASPDKPLPLPDAPPAGALSCRGATHSQQHNRADTARGHICRVPSADGREFHQVRLPPHMILRVRTPPPREYGIVYGPADIWSEYVRSNFFSPKRLWFRLKVMVCS